MQVKHLIRLLRVMSDKPARLKRGWKSQAELAEELGVSVATIDRMLYQLLQAGVPIVSRRRARPYRWWGSMPMEYRWYRHLGIGT